MRSKHSLFEQCKVNKGPPRLSEASSTHSPGGMHSLPWIQIWHVSKSVWISERGVRHGGDGTTAQSRFMAPKLRPKMGQRAGYGRAIRGEGDDLKFSRSSFPLALGPEVRLRGPGTCWFRCSHIESWFLKKFVPLKVCPSIESSALIGSNAFFRSPHFELNFEL